MLSHRRSYQQAQQELEHSAEPCGTVERAVMLHDGTLNAAVDIPRPADAGAADARLDEVCRSANVSRSRLQAGELLSCTSFLLLPQQLDEPPCRDGRATPHGDPRQVVARHLTDVRHRIVETGGVAVVRGSRISYSTIFRLDRDADRLVCELGRVGTAFEGFEATRERAVTMILDVVEAFLGQPISGATFVSPSHIILNGRYSLHVWQTCFFA